MGIHGLLPFLKPWCAKHTHIKDQRWRTVGVDAMCWMHKGAFSCSVELLLGQDTDKFVHFFIRMCETLRYHQVKPVIVFDGAQLPAKAKEDKKRQASRDQGAKDAMALHERRQRGERVSEHELQRQAAQAIKVTSAMISRLQSALSELNIHFLVAPYEADAQLAYMCRTGWVDAVITEDSDLLAYGCPTVFFKMDMDGNGEVWELNCMDPAKAVEDAPAGEPDAKDAPEPDQENDAGQGNTGKRGRGKGKKRKAAEVVDADAPDAAGDSPAGAKAKGGKQAKEKEDIALKLRSWTPERFVQFCVFCGTDYKETDIHIKGLGISNAFKLMSEHKTPERMLKWMQQDKKWRDKFPCTFEEYLTRYNTVVAIFWHYNVFDPRRGECVTMAEAFPHSDRRLADLDIRAITGAVPAKDVAFSVAKGLVDARTLKPRVLEPLTPAERRVIDRLLVDRRNAQREHNFHKALRDDAKRTAEARQASQASRIERLAGLEPSQAAPAPEATRQPQPPARRELGAASPGAPAAAGPPEEEEDDEPPPPELCLLPGDIRTIIDMRDVVLEPGGDADEAGGHPGRRAMDCEDTETPPRLPAEASQGDRTPPPPQAFNPFARKRPAPAAVAHKADASVLPKRTRVFGDAVPRAPSANPRLTVQHQEALQRQMVKPELRPRGGYGAADAARAVLTQRGIYDLEAQDESKDRRFLASYFKPKVPAPGSRAAPVALGAPGGPRGGEAAEDARPEAPNVLSMAAARGNKGSHFRGRNNSGW